MRKRSDGVYVLLNGTLNASFDHANRSKRTGPWHFSDDSGKEHLQISQERQIFKTHIEVQPESIFAL